MRRLRLARARGSKSDFGAAAVEFAFVFPLLLFLIFMMLDLARLLLLTTSLHNAASEGVRVAAKAATRNSSAVVSMTKATFPVAVAKLANSSCDESLACFSATLQNTCATNGLVSVTASETFNFLAPDAVVFSFFIRGSGSNGSADISATATAVCLD